MLFRLASISAAALLALGCGLIPNRGAVELDDAAPSSTGAATPERGVRLQAEYEGNRVWFQIDNFEMDGLLVAPESFAIGGHLLETHYSRDEDVITRFGPRMLDRGASMAGEMVILSVESLENYRLVFHSTQTEPQNWSCEVVPRAASTGLPDAAPAPSTP